MSEGYRMSERTASEVRANIRPPLAQPNGPLVMGASGPPPLLDDGEKPRTAISWERQGDVIILSFNADEVKDLTYTVKASKELKELAVKVGGKMLFLLDNVEFLSSVGIAALVSFHRGVRLLGGQLKVCGIRPAIAQMLSAAGLDRFLDIYDTRAEAIEAFDLGE